MHKNDDYKGVWILAEQSAGRVLRVSYELLTRGRELADKRKTDLTAIIFGAAFDDCDLQQLIECGADSIIAVEAKQLEHFDVEPYSACMLKLIAEKKPEIIIAAATTTGRTLMPYVAIKADTGLTADCTVLDIEPQTGNLLQTRPAIGGNIMATIKTPNHRPQMATVRPRSTKPAERKADRTGQITRINASSDTLTTRAKFLGFNPDESEHGLQDADIIVAAGRGVKKATGVETVKTLCEKLDGALGASRDVVDRGWLSYPHQIGLSGKTVSPKLYVACGISGAIQHLAGMQTSENIVAINTDPDAQIFRVADLGIVGNIFEVLPVICEKLDALKRGEK
ncbi:MAG TPA: electron transfer flavoprotein subunit alpha/FixB family protein [Phycisphaerae bacterium]|nr:electron transfer flavoprotein subunit alpha/FixB family protein [Phycisphaerae bacterium]HPS53092.1 electron transfer flavoprotein subunit alpha/FixB family protein [Phycisphaerae bacterium]